MKIAIIVPYANITYSGGLLVQGRMWKDGLEKIGCEVNLVSPWGKYDWESYDYILMLGFGKLLLDYVRMLSGCKHPKLISAPIIDYPGSMRNFKIRTRYFGSVRLGFNKIYHDLYWCRNYFEFFLVRSEYEKKFITKGMGVDSSKVHIVPISLRFDKNIPSVDYSKKEDFCFHASRLGSQGKNVPRLIAAAKKYGFRLVLAGTLDGEEQRKWLDKLMGNSKNITYAGYLSDSELYDLYMRAKVFALPSLIEGVGMVALEAAVYGAEIVLTNLGAPKEYYNGRAYLVDPFDIDSIGKGVLLALQESKSQPELRDFVLNNYSHEQCSMLLYNTLKENLR